ncbi:hypothetical protein YC2023_047129 [Brassica napus]
MMNSLTRPKSQILGVNHSTAHRTVDWIRVSVSAAASASAALMRTVVVRFADADAATNYCSFGRRRKLKLTQEVEVDANTTAESRFL